MMLQILSFYSGFPNAENLQQTTAAPISYQASKTYVLWQFTQGDALAQYLMYSNWAQFTQKDSSGKLYISEIPSDWQINPLMAEIAPPIMEGWYTTATSDTSFISGASGGIYVHPDTLPITSQFFNVVLPLDKNAQINYQFVIFGQRPPGTSAITNYIQQSGADAIFNWQKTGASPIVISHVPVFYQTFTVSTGTSASSVESQIKSAGTHFVYVTMNANNPGMPFIQQVMSSLGSNYVAVRSDQFVELFCNSQSC